MTVLVTGGAGYVGSHLAALLRRRRIAHVLYDDLSAGHKEMVAGSTLVQGDISSAEQLHAVFAQYKPQSVVHLAALATLGECEKRPDDCHRINVEGTRNVLEAMRLHQVRRIVMAGSCAVYAPLDGPGLLAEKTSPLAPASLYGQSKLAGEKLLAEYHRQYGIAYVLWRIFNVAGADPQERIGESHSPETHCCRWRLKLRSDGAMRWRCMAMIIPRRTERRCVIIFMSAMWLPRACMR